MSAIDTSLAWTRCLLIHSFITLRWCVVGSVEWQILSGKCCVTVAAWPVLGFLGQVTREYLSHLGIVYYTASKVQAGSTCIQAFLVPISFDWMSSGCWEVIRHQLQEPVKSKKPLDQLINRQEKGNLEDLQNETIEFSGPEQLRRERDFTSQFTEPFSYNLFISFPFLPLCIRCWSVFRALPHVIKKKTSL